MAIAIAALLLLAAAAAAAPTAQQQRQLTHFQRRHADMLPPSIAAARR
eukprot:SAG31_NODE_8588_length_1424_cov_5.421132_1_plen_47_part_10